jgi:hypothetical protein
VEKSPKPFLLKLINNFSNEKIWAASESFKKLSLENPTGEIRHLLPAQPNYWHKWYREIVDFTLRREPNRHK